MRTTKTTEVIEEFDEQGRVVRRTTTTTEEREEGAPSITYPWYNTIYDNGNWATKATATQDINVTLDGCATTADSISGTGNPEVTLRG